MTDGFNPPGVIEPFGIFSNAAIEGDGRVVHVAGQVAWDVAGNVVGVGDIQAQTEQVITNVAGVLAHVGGTLDDVASVIVYVTDLSGLDAVHEVRGRHFRRPYPASTLVQVVGLVHPDLLIEISAVAVVPHERFRRPG
jgi:enamine deaminase RidA (YjgF/YER057c/UK114 family)